MATEDSLNRQPACASAAEPLFGPSLVEAESLPDGTVLLRNRLALPTYARSLLDRLDRWAENTPNHLFLAERSGSGWRTVGYRQAQQTIDDFAAALLSLDLTMEEPLLLLAPNGIEHAMIALAAMRIGIPVGVASPALVAVSDGLGRFNEVVARLTPGAVYVGAGIDVSAVLKGVSVLGIPVIAAAAGGDPRVTAIADLPRLTPDAVASLYDRVSVDAPAKILFTSGSTGSPKGVIVTQRMMCSNAAGLSVVWPVLLRDRPVVLDWLPWSHIFGGNCCFNLALYYGGTYYIDDGKPTPSAISRTIDNLRLVAPNVYFNVPLGYEALLPCLEGDGALARRFLSSVHFLFNAGAALPAATRARLEALARKSIGRCPPIIGAWGSTETAPFSTVVCFETPYADNLGIPMPGTTIKLVPLDDRAELRVKGPNVMPAYWRQPDKTAEAFDDQGFYRIGDAGRLAQPDNPAAGIRFCGRLAENFKLASGTWVNVGALRLELIDSTKPYVDDIVITGHGRDSLGALIFPSISACRGLVGGG